MGSYFDANVKKCLACPIGCLSCTDCYTCVQCMPNFNYDSVYKRCVERCGDGLKYHDECDDGNN